MAEALANDPSADFTVSFETRQYLDARRNPDYTAQWDLRSDFGWQGLAACKGSDINDFYPREGEQTTHWRRRQEAAKRVCESCVVRMECLETAVERKEPQGIWGGIDMATLQKGPVRRK